MAKQRRSLSGKVVAITGGARGIGKATATALVRKGCRVAIGDLDLAWPSRPRPGWAAARSRCRSTSPTAPPSTRSSTRPSASSARSTPSINNAGIMPVTPFVDECDDSIRRQLDINLYGVITGTQLAIERMQPARHRPHRQHRLAGRQGRHPRHRHLLGDQARGGRDQRGGAGRAARQRRRGPLRDADRRQHRADRRASARSWSNRSRPTTSPTRSSTRWKCRASTSSCRSQRRPLQVPALLPRGAREAIGAAMKVDKLMLEVDHGARRAYEERAAASEPSAEARPRPSRRRSETPPDDDC